MTIRVQSKEPKVWKCGNPQNSEYKFPMAEPSGDHWEKLLASLLKKDKIQCDSWKEEVQNLLIFVRFILLPMRRRRLIMDGPEIGWSLLRRCHRLCRRIVQEAPARS